MRNSAFNAVLLLNELKPTFFYFHVVCHDHQIVAEFGNLVKS